MPQDFKPQNIIERFSFKQAERKKRTVKMSGCTKAVRSKQEWDVSLLGFPIGSVLVQALAHV